MSQESARERESLWPITRTESIVVTVTSLWLKKKKPRLLAKNNDKNYNYNILKFNDANRILIVE